MRKQVSVLVGAGSIGQAIIRRVSAGYWYGDLQYLKATH